MIGHPYGLRIRDDQWITDYSRPGGNLEAARLVVDAAPLAVVQVAPPAVVDAAPLRWPKHLEGCILTHDHFRDYERLKIQCRAHANCQKYRNVNHRETLHLGPRAALAYLACWTRLANPDDSPWLSCFRTQRS